MKKIYIIGSKAGPYKVGISSDPKKRVTTLQTGNPKRLSLVMQMSVEDAKMLEASVHQAFSKNRLEGEWFDAPLTALINAVKNGCTPSLEISYDSMTPEAFTEWLAEMKSAGLARSDAAAARLLGVHPNSIIKRKAQGADTETALACRALLHRLSPYS